MVSSMAVRKRKMKLFLVFRFYVKKKKLFNTRIQVLCVVKRKHRNAFGLPFSFPKYIYIYYQIHLFHCIFLFIPTNRFTKYFPIFQHLFIRFERSTKQQAEKRSLDEKYSSKCKINHSFWYFFSRFLFLLFVFLSFFINICISQFLDK